VLANLIHVETRAGNPILAGDRTIIPLAKSVRLQFPGWNGGVIWNRPVSVVIRTAGGEEQLLPVRDVTRQVQLALLGGMLGMALLSLLLRRR
jgi:hypothetical protein